MWLAVALLSGLPTLDGCVLLLAERRKLCLGIEEFFNFLAY